MASPDDVDMMRDDDSRVHEPFSIEENIQQLNAIDKTVVELMDHTATAFDALTVPSFSAPWVSTSDAKSSVDSRSQKQAFREATNSFLDALHDVDVRLKRQILALEEAGIINLTSAARHDPQEGVVKASLKPNGVGVVGNLDIGWLNSRGSRVERDMESELWSRARRFLETDGDNIKMS